MLKLNNANDYLKATIVNSILFLIAFVTSLLLVYFFFVKFFNSKIIYIIVMVLILAISNSNYVSNLVAHIYLERTVIYSLQAVKNSNIVIIALFLIAFLLPVFFGRVSNNKVDKNKINKW